jgi:hypothetical protein
VIADKLLEAAARQKAAYQDPYDDPMYAIHLQKVQAKEAREVARAAAAAAKAARWGRICQVVLDAACLGEGGGVVLHPLGEGLRVAGIPSSR